MSRRVELNTVCPNNHNLTVDLTADEFSARLRTGTLEFHCNTCDTNWPPSREEIRKIREAFGEVP